MTAYMGVAALTANRLNIAKGAMLEGSPTVIDEGWGPETHSIPVSIGCCIEERPGEGHAKLRPRGDRQHE